MSLIRIRRERKQEMGRGPAQPPRLWKQLVVLILILLLIYYLSQIT